MNELSDFFFLGFRKATILDLFGHVLFIVALCGIYTFKTWRMVSLFLATFIPGYLITFTLSTFNLVDFPQGPVAYLIPLTILVTALTNFFIRKQAFTNKYPSQNYRFYLSFISGLIHGLAFPGILKPALSETDFISQVLIFNLGVFSAIFMIGSFLLLTSFVITYFIRVNIREWNLIVSGACAGIALYIMANLAFPV